MTTAIALIVLTCRFKYALAPSCTALEISRIRSLPAGDRITAAIKPKAKTRPITAHTIDNGTPELRMFMARKFMIVRTEAHDSMKNCRAGKGILPAFDTNPLQFTNSVYCRAFVSGAIDWRFVDS